LGTLHPIATLRIYQWKFGKQCPPRGEIIVNGRSRLFLDGRLVGRPVPAVNGHYSVRRGKASKFQADNNWKAGGWKMDFDAVVALSEDFSLTMRHVKDNADAYNIFGRCRLVMSML
jgi:hypothetical protein